MKHLYWQSLPEVGELHLVEEEQRNEEKRREEASQREKEKEKEAPETRWWFQLCFIFVPIWGFMIQFHLRIFFRWVGKNHQKPETLLSSQWRLTETQTVLTVVEINSSE